MKIYADAGLVQLGTISSHRAETLTTLIKCSSFRRTHNFLLQTYEAFYRFFISLYIAQLECSSTVSLEGTPNYRNKIETLLLNLIHYFASISSPEQLQDFREKVSDTFEKELHISFGEFSTFKKDLTQKQDTIKFWYQFIVVDCFAYLRLYVATRYHNWPLRTGSIKLLASIFSACDCPTFQCLIPQHFNDQFSLPEPILIHLQNGRFSAHLMATEWHGVAIDKCHKMQINKDAKLAVVRPSQQRMEYLSDYLPYCSACIKNLQQQLFPNNTESIPRLNIVQPVKINMLR